MQFEIQRLDTSQLSFKNYKVIQKIGPNLFFIIVDNEKIIEYMVDYPRKYELDLNNYTIRINYSDRNIIDTLIKDEKNEAIPLAPHLGVE